MSLGDAYENKVLDAILGDGRAAAMPAIVYVALWVGNPGEAGAGGAEVGAGVGYTRVAVANTTANWPVAAASQKKNAGTIAFPTATGAGWGTPDYFALMDAASAGNVILDGALAAPVAVPAGDTPVFTANQLVATAD